MGSITSYRKQIVVLFLALSLSIQPSSASSVGGWSMGNPIAQGASTIYEGSKNVIINGADYVKKGTAQITPTAANVAKTLGKGVGGVAVSVVIDQLFDGVDWVLDPANNQIKYNEVTETQISGTASVQGVVGSTTADACKKYVAVLQKNRPDYKYFYGSVSSLTQITSNTYTYDCKYSVDSDPNDEYAPYPTSAQGSIVNPVEIEQEQKTVPLATVASQIISNAESETDAEKKAAAQVVTTAAAADIVAEAETDSTKARPIAQQLESTSTTKPADQAVADKAAEAQGTAKPNEANPQATDLSLEFPAFCGWAPTVCEFAQTAIQSIADAKAEYADKPQENTDTELEIPDLEQDIEVDTDISFGGSCPAPLTSQVNFMGINETIEFSFENVCEIAEFIKPVVISVSAFSAALIVAGIRTEDD